MPRPGLVRAFVTFWWTLGGVLLLLSVQTAREGFIAHLGGGDIHAALLGTIEAVAAILFLVPRTNRAGGIALLVVFSVAFAMHALQGRLAAPLLIYAAGVIFVIVHGPVPIRLATASARIPGPGGDLRS